MSTGEPRLRVLLLCDDNPANANTMLDHIDSFQTYSRHHVNTFNPRGIRGSRTLDFNEFDVVVIHWSLSLIHDHYVHRHFRDRLAAFRGLKVHFLQDDYRWVDRMTAEQRRVGINVLFTLVSPEHFDKIWTTRLPGVRLVSTLAGYVPQGLLDRPAKPMSERPLDIVYRGREVPWWLGRLGQDKVIVGRGVKPLAEKAGLKVDIAWTEADRIYGERWVQFLGSSRTTIGCEGGASITDFDGSIEEAVRRNQRIHPGSTFDQVHAAVLQRYEGNVPMNVVTPRLFEAAALRTALVLFPGRYSDVLEPGRHYIPLEKDFSNFDTVARLIKDDEFLTELAERTYREIAASPKYSLQRMVSEFDRVLDEEGRRRAFRPMIGYQLAVGQRRLATVVNGQRIAVAQAFAKTFAKTFVGQLTRPIMRVRVVRHPGHYAARGYMALGATFRSRDRAVFLARSVLPRSGLEKPRLDVLLEDMLKIDILCQAQRPPRSRVQLFKAWPHLHPDGVLELRSFPPGKIDAEAIDAEEAMRAIQDGSVAAVVWNHSQVADKVYQSRSGKHDVWLGTDGTHDFVTLRHLLQTNRSMAARILRPAIVPPIDKAQRQTRRLPKAAPTAPSEFQSQARRLVRDPIGYLVRVYVVARLILPNRGFRRVVGRYLADPRLRSTAAMDSVLGDLLRLDALSRACANSSGVSVHLESDAGSGHWSYVTKALEADGQLCQATPSIDCLTKITWDHSLVSSALDVPVSGRKPIKVSLGSAGIYEFSSLPIIARYEPDLIASILPVPGSKGKS